AGQATIPVQPVDVVSVSQDDRRRSRRSLAARGIGFDQIAELRVAFIAVQIRLRCKIPFHTSAALNGLRVLDLIGHFKNDRIATGTVADYQELLARARLRVPMKARAEPSPRRCCRPTRTSDRESVRL